MIVFDFRKILISAKDAVKDIWCDLISHVITKMCTNLIREKI